MDYSRFNYTAQPEDGIAINDLIPRIGPYDKYIIRWGYTPIPSARSADAEWATLDQWSREQDTVPWYRFNMSDSRGADPGDHSEAVGDADAVKATGWGMKSIKQIVPLLVPATVRDGQNYDDLAELYGRLIGQWATELSHVADVVGGTQAQEKYAGQAGPRYVPNSRQRQKDAVKFLNENAFATPTHFLVDDILRKIEVEGAIRRINQSQSRVLNTLFNDRRLERLIEFDALAKPGESYPLAEMAEATREEASSLLDEMAVVVPDRLEADKVLLEGTAAIQLADASSDLDLLCLGSRGYGPVRRVLLGSVSTDVVHHAASAVLVVPRTETDND